MVAGAAAPPFQFGTSPKTSSYIIRSGLNSSWRRIKPSDQSVSVSVIEVGSPTERLLSSTVVGYLKSKQAQCQQMSADVVNVEVATKY